MGLFKRWPVHWYQTPASRGIGGPVLTTLQANSRCIQASAQPAEFMHAKLLWSTADMPYSDIAEAPKLSINKMRQIEPVHRPWELQGLVNVIRTFAYQAQFSPNASSNWISRLPTSSLAE